MKGAAFSERRAVPDKNAAAYAAEKLLISVTKNYIIPREENKMNKKVISALLCGAMVLGAATPVMAEGAGDGQKIALVGKSAGNAFFEIAAASFKETVEAEGGTVEVVYPETATADAQISS